jgi:hypothetical protein
MTNMLNGLKTATNVATTENGARAFRTTQSAVLDLFAQGGALRERNEAEIISLFTKAFAEDKLLALKALFYLRDVRGGQGERRTFRTVIRYLADNHTESVRKNIWLFPAFGRWDDLYELFGTRLEEDAIQLIRSQFEADYSTEHPSLLAKWLKSENTSSPISRKLGRKTREALGLSPRQYRKALSALRSRITLVETRMSQKEFSAIDYSQVPSQASLRYRQAFYRNDGDRYTAFIESLKRGDKDVKINTKTLYPYEIVSKIPLSSMSYRNGKYYTGFGLQEFPQSEVDTLSVLWSNLPDYFGDNTENSICVVDTSGSMQSNGGLPIQTALSLGIYTAERNRGPYHNHFITFSNRPDLVELQGSNIVEKVINMSQANWDMNTNVEAVFDLILNTAIKNRLSQDDMIGRIYIISDMEFDGSTRGRGNDEALFETITRRYAEAGYKMPQLVFWNVNARNAQFPMTKSSTGVQLVSGHSPIIFKNLLRGKFMSAYELMLDVLNDERYNEIRA